MSHTLALALVLGILAGCRSRTARIDSESPPADDAQSAVAPPQDVELAVEIVRLQHVSADDMADVLGPPRRSSSLPRQNENRFCALPLPENRRTPPETHWTVAADPAQNAIVIRGTPAKVAALRAIALAIDRDTGASNQRAP